MSNTEVLARIRRRLSRRGVRWGFLAMIAGSVWEWSGRWGRAEFIYGKLRLAVNAFNDGWLPGVDAAISSGVQAVRDAFALVWSPFWIRMVLMFGGLALTVYVAGRPDRPGEQKEQLALKLEPPPRKRPDPAKLRDAAHILLIRAIDHGTVIWHSPSTDLAREWDATTAAMVRAIWGPDEEARYRDESGYQVFAPQDRVSIRLEKLKDIGRRAHFNDPPIRDDFVPEQWDYDPSYKPLPPKRWLDRS